MMYGLAPIGHFGMAFGLIYILVIGAFLYLFYSMSNSLRRIANSLDKNQDK